MYMHCFCSYIGLTACCSSSSCTMIVLWLMLTSLSLGSGVEITLTQDSTLCPTVVAAGGGGPCSTLNDQISSTKLIPDNSIISFTPGTHKFFNTTGINAFIIEDVYNITLAGIGGFCEIVCEDRMIFTFLNVTNLTISNLSFVNCGGPIPRDIVRTLQASESFFSVTNFHYITLFLNDIENLQLLSVNVTNSFGYGLLGRNIMGNSIVSHSEFRFNNFNFQKRGCSIPESYDQPTCAGGGFAIGYTDTPTCEVARDMQTLDIVYSSFEYNVNLGSSVGSGLTVALAQSNYGVKVHLDNVRATKNQCTRGANIALFQYGFTDNSSFTISNSISEFGNSNGLFVSHKPFLISSMPSYSGGGLWYSYGYTVSPGARLCSQQLLRSFKGGDLLSVYNTSFIGNKATIGAGAYVWVFPHIQEQGGFESNIRFENCYFGDNIGSSGSALYVNTLESIRENFQVYFYLDDCTFQRNNFSTSYDAFNQDADFDIFNTVYFNSIRFVSLSSCWFSENYGTALFAYNTRMRFHGNSTFDRNRGNGGGGMAIHGSSIMIMHTNSSIAFTNNVAKRGGAIFVSHFNYFSSALLCFWQIDPEGRLDDRSDKVSNLTDFLDIHLIFSGNEAHTAGSVLYAGVRADDCSLSLTTTHPFYSQNMLFQQLFIFEEQTASSGDISLISSNPSGVCLCIAGKPPCNQTTTSLSIFPGQTITLCLISVDRRLNPSPGIVLAHLTDPNSVAETNQNFAENTNISFQLGAGQQTRYTAIGCTDLRYTIFSTQRNLTLHLKTSSTIVAEKSTLVSIRVDNCPLGFNFSNDNTYRCICAPYLASIDATCNIETLTVTLDHPYWVGKDENVVKINRFCPLDYCIPGHVEVSLDEQDLNKQCAYNRSGVLCGECAPGYSVIFGGNECWECSNFYLFLIIVYAAAGLLLVFMLYFLNTLTVSVGAINGLIFYANIIQVNRAIFIPPIRTSALSVVISWINLDLGIPVCFYDGLDAYVKTWLQFVFPLYLLAILACIVVVSHYSPSASKIFTNRAVGVFTTILLLIFSRIQRLTTNCLTFQNIEHFIDGGDSFLSYVWSFDGNIGYVEGRHILLFIVGWILFLFVLLPFIFVLLFAKQFQALSSYKYFRWVNKLKPLFDAYMGPYKDSYRGWTGLLLFIRQVLIIVNFCDPTPEANTLAIIIICQLLSMVTWFDGGVYRKWPLNIIEFSYLLNLSVTAAATWYIHPLDATEPEKFVQQQSAVIYTSVIIAILEFMGIFFYALYIRITEMSFKQSYLVKFQQFVIAIGKLPKQLQLKLSRKKPEKKRMINLQEPTAVGATSTVVDVQGAARWRNRSSFGEQSDINLRESLLDTSSI